MRSRNKIKPVEPFTITKSNRLPAGLRWPKRSLSFWEIFSEERIASDAISWKEIRSRILRQYFSRQCQQKFWRFGFGGVKSEAKISQTCRNTLCGCAFLIPSFFFRWFVSDLSPPASQKLPSKPALGSILSPLASDGKHEPAIHWRSTHPVLHHGSFELHAKMHRGRGIFPPRRL